MKYNDVCISLKQYSTYFSKPSAPLLNAEISSLIEHVLSFPISYLLYYIALDFATSLI